MELLIKLYDFVTKTAEEPTNFGIYHIVCVLSVALLTVIASKLFANSSDRVIRRISGILWVIVLLLEIYKQTIYGLSLEDGKFVWDYAWYAFPFQFCSSPLYILPIIAFAKNEKLRDACVSYMMTFSLFAGLAVFCYPNDVFVETIGINLQTMIHHGSQIFIGILYAVNYRAKLGKKFFLSGVLVFVVMTFIAMTLNICTYHAFMKFGIDETFNMFYISPYFDCTLPVLNLVYGRVPYVAFVCVYFFGFILCALIVYGVINGIMHAVKRSAMIKSEESNAAV